MNEDIEELIRAKAYEIWLELGRPSGQDLDIWLQAEKEIGAKPVRRRRYRFYTLPRPFID